MARRIAVFSAFSAACVSSLSLLKRDAGTSFKERPVMKIVRLLQDMKTELEHELEDDKAVHEQLGCWCQENDQEKTKAIELGVSTEGELESFLDEAAAKMKELKTKRDSSLDEVNANVDALSKARELRMKENKAFHGEEVDLIEAVKACDQALVVLKEYNPNPAGLAQVRAVAQRLQQAQVLELVKRSQKAPSGFQLETLQKFLATSFLSVPGYQSYGSQSGQIYGILEQMKEDFEADLSSSQRKEKQAAEAFTALKSAKEEEIAAGRKLVADLEGEIADLKVKHAQAFKELEDTQAQLALDRTFLSNLKKKCSESADEYDTRVKDRLEEISAVSDTIQILNSDAAFETFDKSVNTALLQTALQAGVDETQLQHQRLRDVSAMLQKAGSRLGAPQLMLLASKAQLDAFTKVKQEIDKMIAQLKTQQEDEVTHRDWCLDEKASNERSIEAGNDKQANIQTKIASAKKTIEDATKEIELTVAAVAEMQEQMKRASENREAENADFQEIIQDQRMTQIILQKAMSRMQEVYAFVQRQPGAPHVQTSGTHTDPGNGPARFTKYEKKPGGSRVVDLLQGVLADSKKSENDALGAEQDAQSAYEMFMTDSNKAIYTYNKKVMNMKGAVARAKEELILAETDLNAVTHDLESLHATGLDLNQSCDFLVKNFDARQAARTAEIDALGEAKAILSGAK